MRLHVSTRSLLFALLMLVLPAASSAQIIFSINIAPPPLPVYDQPICPGDGYIWTPGYWAYAADGYFWVPGTWVLAPEPGFLWTPGYWGWGDGAFVFNEGYWGAQIGFYGGINYGFGYVGVGYEGGYWQNGAFFYNRSVNNVTNITNVYNKTVIVNNVTVSYNGGNGGLTARPTPQEQAAASARHIPPTSVQTEHAKTASTNRQLYESANHGKPPIAATAKPGQFSGGVVAAKSAAPSYKPVEARKAAPAPGGARSAAPEGGRPATPEAARPGAPAEEKTTAERPATAVHPKDLPPAARPAPSTGNSAADKKYQQQQEKLNTSQERERQQLQQKQDQEHQQLAKTKANDAAKQQVEQKHQQQTQQLVQKHSAEQQKLQAKHPAAKPAPEEKR
jgi:WXXGXW repeat (2 copies)